MLYKLLRSTGAARAVQTSLRSSGARCRRVCVVCAAAGGKWRPVVVGNRRRRVCACERVGIVRASADEFCERRGGSV